MFCDDEYLHASNHASNIEAVGNNAEVVLTGWVDVRFAKRRVEDLAKKISGVAQIENGVRINQNKK